MPFRSTGSAELDDLVARHVRYGQTRRAEALLAQLMAAIGVSLLIPGDTFALPSFRIVASLLGPDRQLSELLFGLLGVGTGGVRLWALWMNGRRTMPAFRLAGCAVGFFFWLGWAGSFALTSPPVVPLLPMSLVLMAAELLAVGLVTRDLFAFNTFNLRRRRYAADD